MADCMLADVSQKQALKLGRQFQMFPDFPEILEIFPHNVRDFPFISCVSSLRAMIFVTLVFLSLFKTITNQTNFRQMPRDKSFFLFLFLFFTITSWREATVSIDNII